MFVRIQAINGRVGESRAFFERGSSSARFGKNLNNVVFHRKLPLLPRLPRAEFDDEEEEEEAHRECKLPSLYAGGGDFPQRDFIVMVDHH